MVRVRVRVRLTVGVMIRAIIYVEGASVEVRVLVYIWAVSGPRLLKHVFAIGHGRGQLS